MEDIIRSLALDAEQAEALRGLAEELELIVVKTTATQ